MREFLRNLWCFLRPLPITRVANPIPGVLECTADGFAEVDLDELERDVNEIYDKMEERAFRNGWVSFTTH